jgi:YidC/Oxa1 family membrane protein insertase
MDRTAWIAITLCVLGLVAWEIWATRQRLPHPASVTPAASPAFTPPVAPSATPTATPPPAAPTPAPVTFPEKIETFRNSDLELHLTNRGGAISEAILLNHAAPHGGNVRLNSPAHLPIGAILTAPQDAALPEFTIARNEANIVQFTQNSGELTTRKSFAFPQTSQTKDNFLVNMDVDFSNGGSAPFRSPVWYVALGSAAPIHGSDYSNYTRLAWCVDGKAKGIDVNWFASQTYPLIGVQKRAAQEFYTEKVSGAEWAGTTNQFFATLITPLQAKAIEVWGRRSPVNGSGNQSTPTYAIEGAMGMPPIELAPGETKTLRFEIYAGPKLYARLAALNQNQAEIMNFGIWKLVSQFLLNLMNLLHSVLRNYAAAIVLLTIIIKAVLWPLQNKANASMRRMSALSPKMQELREKYKDDPQRMNQEVMKLYKDYGVNPVGGCWPMMIQIPIFFGLFSMLGQAVELRNAKFLWVRDLSQPDTVAHLPVLGWPVNILPICMALTNVLLMRMTPKTGDTTQQRIIMFMPLIFLFFCYNFAAALALYYTTLNLLTVLQLYVNQRQPAPVMTKVTAPERGVRKQRR